MRRVVRILPSLSEKESPEVTVLKCFSFNFQLLEQHPDHTSKVLNYLTPWQFFFNAGWPYLPQTPSTCLNLPNSGNTDLIHHSWHYALGFLWRPQNRKIVYRNINAVNYTHNSQCFQLLTFKITWPIAAMIIIGSFGFYVVWEGLSVFS